MAQSKPKITPELITRLEYKSYELRKKLLKLTGKIGGSHIGGSFSMMDMMVALHYHHMNIDPKNPKKEDRDIFILSKGHAGVGYCTVLGDRGFFEESELDHFNQTGSYFGIHPDHKKIAGVEASTGSLGHGLGLGLGFAIAKRMDKRSEKIFVMMSDGELHEGSVWEAFLAASHYKTGNLVCILDYNKMSQDGPITEIMDVAPVKQKIEAFNWTVTEIDGHNMRACLETLEKLQTADTGRPNLILMNTVKGKGVSFMQNTAVWHYGGMDQTLEAKALADLDQSYTAVIQNYKQLGN